MKRHLRCLACFLLVSPVCFTQTIKVRVVDIRNEHPLANLHVSLSLLYDEGEKAFPKYDTSLRGETDANGEVQFKLPEPAPAHLSTWVSLVSEEHWWCGCSAVFETQDVAGKGIVEPRPGPWSKKTVKSVQAAPGEIILLARPWTLFERILAPLLRG